MKRLYSKSTGGIYIESIHRDAVPDDAVEITDEEFQRLTAGVASQMTRDDIEAARLRAYADPLAGSDRYFAEAHRMQAMGEEGWQDVRDRGAARYQEIQQQYPWPVM